MKHCEENKRIDNYGVLRHRCDLVEGHAGFCHCECGEQWWDEYFAVRKKEAVECTTQKISS